MNNQLKIGRRNYGLCDFLPVLGADYVKVGSENMRIM